MKKAKHDWPSHIEAITIQGISTRAYAKRHDLALSALYYWQRKLKSAPPVQTKTATKQFAKFVALRINEPQRAPEQFQQFWDYDSPTWAGKFLDQWIALVMRSRIEPMKKVAKTLRSHRELILNYFRAKKQFSSGVVEGLKNKVKVTMRKSYGFRTFRITELALYHVLGKLPEPELAHRFY